MMYLSQLLCLIAQFFNYKLYRVIITILLYNVSYALSAKVEYIKSDNLSRIIYTYKRYNTGM